MLQAASVFVLYATSQANTVATNQSRKTIAGPDVIAAMNEMEFEKFVRPLENSLASEYWKWFILAFVLHGILCFIVWKKGQQDKKEQAAKKKAAKKADESGKEKDSKETEVIEIDWC